MCVCVCVVGRGVRLDSKTLWLTTMHPEKNFSDESPIPHIQSKETGDPSH